MVFSLFSRNKCLNTINYLYGPRFWIKRYNYDKGKRWRQDSFRPGGPMVLMDKTGPVPRPITLDGDGPIVPIGGKTGV